MANLTAMAMILFRIWRGGGGYQALFTAIVALGAVPAHANLCLLVPLKPGQRWLALGTIGLGAMTAILIFAGVAMDIHRGDSLLLRLAAATAIFAGCGSLALLVLARLNRGANVEPGALPVELNIALTCPRCQSKQSLPLGGAACSGCNLRIHITVEEPRCLQCGYLLYQLTSPQCPECGTAIQAGAAPSPAAT